MSICPKCKEEIGDLRFSAEVQKYGDFNIDENGYENWDNQEDGDWDNVILCCPECNAELFYDSQEAKEFLENKDELKKMLENKIKKEKK